jgi:hypothetical protein
MRSKGLIAVGALGALIAAGTALAQDNTTGGTQRQTTTSSTTSTTTTKPVAVSGTVVKYTAGQSITLRGTDGQEVTYPLTAGIDAPVDVSTGSTVTLHSDATGSKVARISTTGAATQSTTGGTESGSLSATSTTTTTTQGSTYGAQGSAPAYDTTQSPQPNSSTQDRSAQGADATAAEVTTVTGTVQAYEAGRSITITRPDGSQVTYTITAQSAVPQKLTTGKTVTVRTTRVSGQPTVQRVTYTTTTTTTTKKSS